MSLRHALLYAASLIILSAPAIAQDRPGTAAPEAAATRIEVDEKSGVIRFFIEGEEKARLDAAGLHVRENIDYGGMLTDFGPGGFDRHVGEGGENRDAP